jgi:hypothetical protein
LVYLVLKVLRSILLNLPFMLASHPENSSGLSSLLRKYPTSAYIAGRLQTVGWDSDYGKSLLSNFREDLIRECGADFSEVLRQLRLVSHRAEFEQR